MVCDLPVSEGGDNTGPTPLELSVMALAGCAMTIFIDVCKRSKIELDRFEVAAQAEKKPGSATLIRVNLKANASSKARTQLLEAAWRRTEANCPVLLIFEETIPVRVEFEAITT